MKYYRLHLYSIIPLLISLPGYADGPSSIKKGAPAIIISLSSYSAMPSRLTTLLLTMKSTLFQSSLKVRESALDNFSQVLMRSQPIFVMKAQPILVAHKKSAQLAMKSSPVLVS